MNWLNKCDCIITGAASGLGRALAIELARDYNCRIAALDRNEDGLNTLLKELPGEHLSYTMDVTNKEDWTRMVLFLEKSSFSPDILINNAGIVHPFRKFEQLDEEEVNRIIDVNLHGTLHGVRAVLPELKNSPKATIINVSSSAAFLALPGLSVYTATKAAIRGFTDDLAEELFGEDVKVILVHPGAVQTSIYRPNQRAKGESRKNVDNPEAYSKLGLTPSRAAHLFVKGLKRRKSRILIGTDSRWMDRVFRWMPGKIVTIIGQGIRRRSYPIYQKILEGGKR